MKNPFLGHTSHISGAQSHVAAGCSVGHCRYRTCPSSQKILLDCVLSEVKLKKIFPGICVLSEVKLKEIFPGVRSNSAVTDKLIFKAKEKGAPPIRCLGFFLSKNSY